MGITALRERRKRGDLIEIFKVVRCEEPINWVKSPEIKSSILNEGPCGAIRGDSPRLVRESFPEKKKNDFANALSIRHGFFLNRLPESLIQLRTVKSFKANLDRLNGIGCNSTTSS